MVVSLKNVRVGLLGHVQAVRHAEPVELPEWWTFDLVRDALVEVADLWWRSPGGRGAQYASDGPWRQMLREDRAGDWDARGVDGRSSDVPITPLPLSKREVELRDRVSEWLQLVDDPADRRLIVAAVSHLARGKARVPWRRIKHQMGVPFGEDGLRRRYERALGAIAKSLNGAEKRR